MRFGGTAAEAGPALETVEMETRSDMAADTQVALAWLKSNGASNGKIGAVGFGFGATAIVVIKGTALNCAVIFYGHPPGWRVTLACTRPNALQPRLCRGPDPIVGCDCANLETSDELLKDVRLIGNESNGGRRFFDHCRIFLGVSVDIGNCIADAVKLSGLLA